MTIRYGCHTSPFGDVFIAITPKGICKLSFLDNKSIDTQLDELIKKWPHAILQPASEEMDELVASLFSADDRHRSTRQKNTQQAAPLSLHVSGTNFQVSVWRALLNIPPGSLVSYSQVAEAIGKPKAVRAVGSAIGANPVALLIPCHRVIQQSGKLGGYRWGETRKHAIHARESAWCD